MRMIAVALMALLAGCGGSNSSSEPPPPPPPEFQTCARPSCDPAWVSELHIDQWFWSAGTIYGETVMPLATVDGTLPHFPLWRPFESSSSVLQVAQWVDGKVLTPGTDYHLYNNELMIPDGSSVRLAPHDFPFVANPNSEYQNKQVTKQGGPLRIGDFASYQLAVTYRAYDLAPPPMVKGALPKYNQKLVACSPIAITFMGDSLMALGRYPIATQVAAYLTKQCPGQIQYRSISLGGYQSGDGNKVADSQLNDMTSDVIVIAFGVNDASDKPVSATAYQKNISSIISTVRAKAPNTEFVLVAAPEGNPDWAYMSPESFPAYRDALVQLTEQLPGVAMVDVTTTWRDIIAHKTYYDVTSSGVNHPADFGLWIYSQVLLKLLADIP